MISRIIDAIRFVAPAAWRIEERKEETAELFFVKKQLDTRRSKDVTYYTVTLFRKDDAGRIGSTAITLPPEIAWNDLKKQLADACYAASFAMNPGYAMPDPVQAAAEAKKSPLLEKPLAETAAVMSRALFEKDTHPSAFLNSAELFVERKKTRIVSSEGTDVSWTGGRVNGEFVAQCKEPEDVEIYQDFSYDDPAPEALSALAAETLSFAADRARAQKILKSGSYDLILTGANVGEILSFYTGRSSARMIYPGYSRWKKGEAVQEAQEGFESLSLSLKASEPFSEEGIPMKDRVLLDKGVLKTIHGSNRFCRYLGEEATGEYRTLRCDNSGSLPFEALKKAPCLWAVTFSDFQMDPMSGYLGGEMRLAYLIEEDGKVTPVTGGSVSALLLEKQGQLLFSKERYVSARYEGPYAVRIPAVSVAGE